MPDVVKQLKNIVYILINYNNTFARRIVPEDLPYPPEEQ